MWSGIYCFSWCGSSCRQLCEPSELSHHLVIRSVASQHLAGLLSSAAAGIENEFFIDNILIKIKDYNERTNQIVTALHSALPGWFDVLQEGEGGGGPGGRRGRGTRGATAWPTDPSVFLPVLVLTEGPAVSRHPAAAAGLGGSPATVPARLHQQHQLQHQQRSRHHQHHSSHATTHHPTICLYMFLLMSRLRKTCLVDCLVMSSHV